ncbi:MAG: maleate cis-trans isomerase family protein, partial [Candidatus Rokuibacteriota bacterium]
MSPRKRIGVMVPSTNTTCEADFQLTVPRDITIHGQRLWMTNEGAGDEAFERMNAENESGARYLATANEDVVVYG